MKIADIYRFFCQLYRISDPVDIEHFLLLEDDSPSDIHIGNAAFGREALLIRQSEEGLEMGLFIDPAIIAALECSDALDHLDAFSCAIEGVSHFVYVADRIHRDRRVTKLELELQAEVDKFLRLQLEVARHAPHRCADLFARQFERHAFDTALSSEDLECYATAHHFAAKYCAHLQSSYFHPLRLQPLIDEARDFFHRDLPEKVSRLIP